MILSKAQDERILLLVNTNREAHFPRASCSNKQPVKETGLTLAVGSTNKNPPIALPLVLDAPVPGSSISSPTLGPMGPVGEQEKTWKKGFPIIKG